tara:strand:+ start:548 stop:2866 length:2319 start_codon:yes stop_codon:yes gene_type:complete
MNFNSNQKLFINKNVDKFFIRDDKTLRDAISLFGNNFGLPLIVINNNNEFIGTLSNGDIRLFLADPKRKIVDSIKDAVNKKAKYCFEDFDKSIFEHFLSEKNIKIIPILDKFKKLKAVAYYENIYLNLGKKVLKTNSNNIYLIAEIGVNHNGDFEEAIALVDNIYEAGFDAVKMQFRSSETYSNDRFINNVDLGTEYILSELERVALTYKEEEMIIEHIKKKNLDFIGTPFDQKSLLRLINYEPTALKVASCDLTNHFLIKSCANYNVPLILSTGMSNETEIIKTNQLLEDLNVNRCFLHCNSTYPTPLRDVNLKYIHRLQKITNCIVGYSSHDGDQTIAIGSIASGAKVIEVHVTKNRSGKGTDHLASITVDETKQFVTSSRKISIANGYANPRIPSQGELLNKIPLGKSLCYAKNLNKGHIINASNDFIACSPGDGIKIDKNKEFNNKLLKADVNKLDKVLNSHFDGYIEEKIQYLINNQSKEILKEFKWGIPARYRDIEVLNDIFESPILEIHLSSKDLEFDITNLSKNKLNNKEFIVHAIEQYHDGFIFDLASDKEEYRDVSLKRFDELISHCNQLLDYFGSKEKIKIILNCGGFTRDSFCDLNSYKRKKKYLYENLIFLKDKYKEFKILPQTMPPFPWHQGGTSYHNLLRNSKDIAELNQETGLKVCFDFSHTFMESVYSKIDFNKNLLDIINYTDHLHLSDSSSSSNEGLNIDDGNIDFQFAFKEVFKVHKKNKITFIPEVWQGHLNNGEGFKISLNRISRYLAST